MVDHHVSSILTKLGVRSRAGVVREAARLRLLVVPVPPDQPS
jgi:DNA-binding CsgD family transcriptional regulator